MIDSSGKTKERGASRRPYGVREPEDMRPDERFDEIATILAKGYLRLRARQNTESRSEGAGEAAPESSRN